jgi:uncharacterized protein YndB with AHSA1/START domain
MIKIEKNIIINRSVEEVWKFLSNVENMPKWDRGVLEARQTSEGLPGVGSTMQIRRQFFGRQRIVKIRVSEYVLNRRIALQGNIGAITVQTGFTFEPVEAGTRLTQPSEIEIGGWWKWITPILLSMLNRDGGEDLANLKRIIEISV